MNLLRLCATLLPLACLSSPTDPGVDIRLGPGTRVLFVGNSLTYSNDLPAALSAVATLAGDTIEARYVAFPDYSLEDHWNEGTALKAIKATSWDYVVMQQGPSSLPENQLYLKTWTEKFAPEIRAAGATPALYMVWPSLARQPGDWPGVKAAYKNAATAVQGIFLPAGEAWRVSQGRTPSLNLYSADGFHPSAAGTVLAALVIYERLTGRDVSTINFPSGFGGVSSSAMQALTQVAHETVVANRDG
jgi:hypothetical protein